MSSHPPTTDPSNFCHLFPSPCPQPRQQMRCQQFTRQQFNQFKHPHPAYKNPTLLPNIQIGLTRRSLSESCYNTGDTSGECMEELQCVIVV